MADIGGVGDLAEELAAPAEAFARDYGFGGEGARDYVEAMLATIAADATAAATGAIGG